MPRRKQGISGVYLWAVYQFLKQLAEGPGPPQLPFILSLLFIHQTNKEELPEGRVHVIFIHEFPPLSPSLAPETLFSE